MKIFIKLCFLIITVFVVTGCAQEPIRKITQSGKAEGFYKDKSTEQVRDAILNLCNNRGLMIFDSQNSFVVCGKKMEGIHGAVMQVAMDNAYATTPITKHKFTIANFNDGTKVWVDSWVETQGIAGQVRQEGLHHNNALRNQVQETLDHLFN